MTERCMRSRRLNRGGFTIVELLIVVVVIAILAAITIVVYNGVSAQANDSVVQSDLRQFSQTMERYKVENGQYPTVLDATLGITFTKSAYKVDSAAVNLRYCRDSQGINYALFATSKSGSPFYYSSNGGLRATYNMNGWSVCSLVGLTEVNPQYNGFGSGVWAAWVN